MQRQELASVLQRVNVEPTYSVYTAAANALDGVTSESSGLPPLRVAVLRNFTMDPLVPVLKGEIARGGFYPLVQVGDYDAIGREVFDQGSELYSFRPDIILVAYWLENLAPALVSRFLSLSCEQINCELERVLTAVGDVIASLRRHSEAAILINNFVLPAYTTLGILDVQSESYQTHTILRLNLELLRRVRQCRNVYVVDYMSVIARVGSAEGIDERCWQIGNAPLGRRALLAVGREYGKFFRALQGRTRKCLVLDCDNTIWGGIVGEDGPDHLQLGTAYPGSCYRALQEEILDLHKRGVLLALCSRNNEADVLEVLRSHPDMLLREEHFAARQVNWDDKATNLRRIAEDLNLGLDSLVLVDDSPFECDLVREQLPEVAVLQLGSEPSSFRAQLAAQAYFDSLVFSDEDRKRNQAYRDVAQRKQLYESAGSLSEYLAKLGMVAYLGSPDKVTIPRVSQLTQKTNQFNLTTRRYSEGEIFSLVENPEAAVFYLKLSDRIGDMGMIGLAIVRYVRGQAEIDTFLLSCRALGRGVEDVLLAHVINSAKTKGCASVRGRYLRTAKNSQVAEFYRRRGFRPLLETQEGGEWELLLEEWRGGAPEWIKVELT